MPQPYEEAVAFERPWDEVFEAAHAAVARFPKMVLLATDTVNGRLAVSKTTTAFSWGESIVVDVLRGEDARTTVRVWSSLTTLLWDVLGVNRRNVRGLIRAMTETLGTTPVSVTKEV